MWRKYIIGGDHGWEPTMLAIHTVGDGHGALGAKAPLSMANTAFALLMPWVLVPTITEATLFLTNLTVRRVHICRLSESIDGIACIWSRADWGVGDDGKVRVSKPVPAGPPNAAAALVAESALAARREGSHWSEGFTWDMAYEVSQEMSKRLL